MTTWNKGIEYRAPCSREKNKKQMEIINTFGMAFTPEIKSKQRNAKLGKYGALSNGWKGGTYRSERKEAMARDEYRQLRKKVFIRDNYTCQLCFNIGGKLEMDHIKEWCNYPQLRYDINNCRTLCRSCHKNTPNYGSKARKKK